MSTAITYEQLTGNTRGRDQVVEAEPRRQVIPTRCDSQCPQCGGWAQSHISLQPSLIWACRNGHTWVGRRKGLRES
jgi:hypothetical protein